MTSRFLLLVLLLSLHFVDAYSEEPSKNEGKSLKEETVLTKHSLKIDGIEIPYEARAGNLLLKDEQGHIKASVFYVSYHKENGKDPSKRPITFCFNGGPGSSSIWLHIGLLGPKRVLLNEKQETVPPVQLVDNEYSLLDETDLVFIDPVSSGYSRAAPGEDPKQYYGFEEDTHAIGDFIRLYVTRFNRWNSPKYLAGESYGTTRAAGLASYLHDDHNLYLNGIILISSVLNYQTIIEGQGGNDLAYLLTLPTFTAAAWYHQKLSPELQKDLNNTLEEVKHFVVQEYSVALMQGDKLTTQEKEKTIQKIAAYTGLSPQFVDRCRMRISTRRFVKELLRDQKRTIGRFDSRITGIDSDASGECNEYDPSTNAIFGAFTAAMNTYLRDDLNWKQDEEYVIIAKVYPWNYSKSSNQFLDVADNIREMITRNPALNVFVAKGIYDLATPFYAAEYTFDHLGLDSSLKDRVSQYSYGAGHMMYTDRSSLIKLKNDLSQWFKK